MKQTWLKRDDETNKSYNAFSTYRDMGVQRSLGKARERCNGMHHLVTWERWSVKYDWVKRCVDYDEYLADKTRQSQETAIIKAAKAHIDISHTILEKTLKAFKHIQIADINAHNVARLLELAVKLERDALGIAEKHEVKSEVKVQNVAAEELIKRTEELLKRG